MTRDHPTDHAGASDESPLRRWSRRKHAAQGHTTAYEQAPEPDAEQHPDATADAEPAEHQAADGPAEVTDADLPPVESLSPDSDYSDFMSPKVSESLRRTALRKLFGLPQFNIRDGLDDYDDDYTQFSSLGNTVTADMRYHAERRAAAAREREQAAVDEPSAEPESEHGTAQEQSLPDQAHDTPAPRADDTEAEDDPDGLV